MTHHCQKRALRLACQLSLLLGFTGQSQQMLWEARRLGFLSPALHRRAIAEFLLAVAVWTAVGLLVGFTTFVFAYLLPLVIANVIVMSVICANLVSAFTNRCCVP